MKVLLLILVTLASTTSFASCNQAAESAAQEKFRNLEYGCYGNASLVETLNDSTMRVTVDPVGGAQACSRKFYEVKFKKTDRSCTIVSVNRIGFGGI